MRNVCLSRPVVMSTTFFSFERVSFVPYSCLFTVSVGLITLSANIHGPGLILCSGTIITETWERKNTVNKAL